MKNSTEFLLQNEVSRANETNIINYIERIINRPPFKNKVYNVHEGVQYKRVNISHALVFQFAS